MPSLGEVAIACPSRVPKAPLVSGKSKQSCPCFCKERVVMLHVCTSPLLLDLRCKVSVLPIGLRPRGEEGLHLCEVLSANHQGLWFPLALKYRGGNVFLHWLHGQTHGPWEEGLVSAVLCSRAAIWGCKTSIRHLNPPGDLVHDSRHCSNAYSRVWFQHGPCTMSSHPNSLGVLNELGFAWQVKKEKCGLFSNNTKLIHLGCHIQILSIILCFISQGTAEPE